MFKNKTGFTLAEVLIALTVVGVIMAISVQTIRIVKASYSSLAYFEYKNIQRIAAEMIAGKLPTNITVNGSYIQPPSELGLLMNGKGYAAMLTKNDTLFCRYLVSLANVSGPDNCDNQFTAEFNNTTNEPEIKDLNVDAPTFITTSGRRYYISGRTTHTKVSDIFGYRLIAVDLNGNQKPNIAQRKNNSDRRIPDIVTFLLLDSGDIFPLSHAADNTEMPDGRMVVYLNSKIKGYYFANINRPDDKKAVECTKLRNEDGEPACNFSVVYVQNKHDGKGLSFYSYRKAYCSALGEKESLYKTYCDGIGQDSLCPPSSDPKQFDLCRVENIKPAFRYNF